MRARDPARPIEEAVPAPESRMQLPGLVDDRCRRAIAPHSPPLLPRRHVAMCSLALAVLLPFGAHAASPAPLRLELQG